MLVMIAGTMTMASACAGGMVTASSPIDTVGKPRPMTPLMKPASRNAAAIRSRNESDMPNTLNDRGERHNRANAEQGFGYEPADSLPAPRSPASACLALRFSSPADLSS